MRRKVYRILGTAFAAGFWLGAPSAAFAAGPPPATPVAVQTAIPVETGGLFHFLGHLVHDIFGSGSHQTTEENIASAPITAHNHMYSLKTVTDQQLPVMQEEVAGLTGVSSFVSGSQGGYTHNYNSGNQHTSGSGTSTTYTTATTYGSTPITTVAQSYNPGQVLGGSGILTSFNGTGIPGQQLIDNGYHAVDMLFSGVNTGGAPGQVTATSVANTLPPNTQRLFAKTLLTVSEDQNDPALTATININQWVSDFQRLHPGIPISMVGQPLWGQTVPPLYDVGDSPEYNLSWSAADLAIIRRADAMNTPMPGALKVTLTYSMGYNGQWILQQVFLHFWPDASISNLPKPGHHQGCTVNCQPPPPAQPSVKVQGVTSGLTDSAAMTALARQGQINSLQGSLLASSGGSGGSAVITVGGKNYQLGPNLMNEMRAALSANLRYVFPTVGNGTDSLIQSENTGLTPDVGVSTGAPAGLGLSSGTTQSGSFDSYIGVGTGLAPGVSQQLVQNTVTRSHPIVVKKRTFKRI